MGYGYCKDFSVCPFHLRLDATAKSTCYAATFIEIHLERGEEFLLVFSCDSVIAKISLSRRMKSLHPAYDLGITFLTFFDAVIMFAMKYTIMDSQ